MPAEVINLKPYLKQISAPSYHYGNKIRCPKCRDEQMDVSVQTAHRQARVHHHCYLHVENLLRKECDPVYRWCSQMTGIGYPQEKKDRALAKVAAGVRDWIICKQEGIGSTTLNRWKKEGSPVPKNAGRNPVEYAGMSELPRDGDSNHGTL